MIDRIFSPEETKEINRFTWNADVTESQKERMEQLRHAGRDMCMAIITYAPPSADRSAAIRDLRKAVMQANLAIAHENY